ncbi:hypothetical protein [Streptomyces sp. enrichment culture]|uniref:hypothetical protein n=1 Tax=Streptomyces sp. enrichment culture TaxID=1795815 RepID=UPI003F55B7AA
MLEYEIHKLRQQELIDSAEEQRRVREAVRGRRAARHADARDAEHESHTRRLRRPRFARAA